MSSKTSNPSSPAPKRRLGLIIGLVALLVVGAAGAAAWFMQQQAAEDEEQLDAPAARKQAAPIFVPLDQFTVNLADPGGERMAQIGITLEVDNAKTEAATKTQMPAVRNSILLLLSSSTSAELLTVPGKQQLARRIAELTGQHLGWQPPPAPAAGNGANAQPAANEFVAQRQVTPLRTRPNPIQAVHFSHFIIQ